MLHACAWRWFRRFCVAPPPTFGSFAPRSPREEIRPSGVWLKQSVSPQQEGAPDADQHHVPQPRRHQRHQGVRAGKVERVNKYLDRASEAHVVWARAAPPPSRHHHPRRPVLHARPEKSDDMYASIDLAMDKIERQLKRYKEKLKHHRALPTTPRAEQIGALNDRLSIHARGASPRSAGRSADDHPHRRAAGEADVVDEAVMQMDLLNNDFLVFTNARRRGDQRGLPPQGRPLRSHRGPRPAQRAPAR